MPDTILIKNGLLITMDRERNVLIGDLLIEDGKIKQIGTGIEASSGVETIDAKGKWVFPGFIQGHIHLCQTLFRNQAEELPLLDWLEKKIWPFEAAHTPETMRTSVLLSLAEIIHSGTTTVLDMGTVRHTDVIFQTVDEIGIRGFFGKALMDQDSLPSYLRESKAQALDEAISLSEKWHEHDGGRLRYTLCPRFVLSCTEKMWKEVKTISEQNGFLIHTHASENREETKAVKQITGLGNIEYFHHLGITGPRLALAHCIWLENQEIDILSSTQTRVLHCPTTNLKLGSGVAHVKEFLDAKIPVLLGSDGAPANNQLNILAEMKLASLLQLPRHGVRALPAKKVVEMATIDAANALGIGNLVGSLEVGKEGDIVIIDPNKIHSIPNGDPYTTLVFSCTPQNVDSVFVKGRPLLRAGKLLTIEEKEIFFISANSAQTS